MRLLGTGEKDDPYRVPFPVYTLVAMDPDTKRAIVEIPDATAPDELDDPGTPLRPVLNGRPTLIGFRPQQRLRWLAKVRKRYGKTHGDFDPDVVT